MVEEEGEEDVMVVVVVVVEEEEEEEKERTQRQGRWCEAGPRKKKQAEGGVADNEWFAVPLQAFRGKGMSVCEVPRVVEVIGKNKKNTQQQAASSNQ